jgi:L-ribulose-5-phosphate 3-epimerase
MNIEDRFTFGLYEKALHARFSWPERLELAKKAGYDFVEISIDESDERLERLYWGKIKKLEFVQTILETGIRVPTMCLSGHRRYPIGSSYGEIREKGMEIMRLAIDFAADTGVRIVQLAGYDAWYDEPGTEETAKNYENNIKASLDYASKRGITLAIENMGIPFMDSFEKVMYYVDKYNSPYLQIYPDIGNLSAMNKKLADQFPRALGHIVGIHIKDTPEGVVRRIPFGEGTVDFINDFRIILRSGFTGPLLIEMWADEREDTFDEVRDARLYVIQKIKDASVIL